jgi:molecular chaperone HscB
MEVLEEREALADARAAKDLAKVRAIGEAMTKNAESTQKKLADGFASGGEVVELVPLLGELRFYKRFLDEVAAIEEENDA